MDITGTILLVVIGLVIGILLAALYFSFRKEPPRESASRERVLTDSEHSIRVWREGKARRLVVEMDGVSHQKVSELKLEQSRKMAETLQELQAWLGVSSNLPSPPSSEVQEIAAPTAAEETRTTSLNPFEIFIRSRQPSEVKSSDLSIVAQIDEILQEKLEGIHLDNQGIRLVEGPDQGIMIEVGLNRYTDIDSVPDERVRQLIRVSVSEWERSLGGQ